jgi:hypothetical protein
MGVFEVALSACFGVSTDVFPGFSYSYSALAVLVLVLVLVLENTASSTSTISLSTSTIKAKAAQLQKRWPVRLGACSRATQYDTQIAYVRVGRTRQKDMIRRTQDRVRIAPFQGL